MNVGSFYLNVFKDHFGSEINIENISSVGGGCINQTSKITTNQGQFFIKVNSADQIDLFQKEEKGLDILRNQSSLGIPKVYGLGKQEHNSYLILEWIEKGVANEDFWHTFGHQLALQHRESSDQFGLEHDNHIGRLHQSNHMHSEWTDFFVMERLKPQLALAEKARLVDNKIINQFELLFQKLDELVPNEPPALLHGDLWSGNFLCGSGSKPFIFDPAVYYGHRETELAFTTMFGGFDPKFYTSYFEEFPLEPGFEDRIEIHNLYPLLVHVNLFGPSYLSGIKQTLNTFT